LLSTSVAATSDQNNSGSNAQWEPLYIQKVAFSG